MHPHLKGRAVLAAMALLGAGASGAGTTTIEQPGRGTNRIEVTGNRADGAVRHRCAAAKAEGGARSNNNVNSVNISGRSLQGKTVIVTDGQPGDCGSTGTRGSNINSVNIR
ncbi:MAG: hypothetical protein EOO25_01255 [Comamonadaceae bacterium]|nr:MAG: hypothetical protein EOO25_01255 [Comamonadaceae bacterium]